MPFHWSSSNTAVRGKSGVARPPFDIEDAERQPPIGAVFPAQRGYSRFSPGAMPVRVCQSAPMRLYIQ
jgi:hypothetical protein